MSSKGAYPGIDALWYKKAIIYELHVKSYCDSNNDGIGDFQGLIQKLDYLQGLGITALWLLPFYPSPLRDDGYDIADYFSINSDYGSLSDFREFLKEAHRRGIRVITELVVNHTSEQHPWFERARRGKPGSSWRNFYVWSDTPEKYKDARIIFKDFETSNWTWDAIAKAYYWHRFYSHQPDLNYENPLVQKEILRVVDFWFGMGVDGLRLDAVPYLYEEEGTNCENLAATHQFLKKLRSHVDNRFKNRMLLSEANQWPEDAASYLGNGDECHMAFHFPVMPRLFMSLWMEDRFPLIDILQQTPAIPENCQWAMFLRNHDELTLEMVTDEERDYMYRVFAKDSRARINLGIRRRLAPLLGNNRRKIELMNILLFSLPGTPVIYYGDEVGMGDNYYLGDRDGVRTPMQWGPDRNAGFSRAAPQKLYLPAIIDSEYHYEAINVENQEANLSSLLWWMKRVIAMRNKLKALSLGSIEFVSSDNAKILSFIRSYADQAVLIVVNLSRFSQVVRLDLSRYAGFIPEEAFSGNKFPAISNDPYTLTLGFHDYYWFILGKQKSVLSVKEERTIPELSLENDWRGVSENDLKGLEEILPAYLAQCRWFAGKAKSIRRVVISKLIPLSSEGAQVKLLLLEVHYTDGPMEIYVLPVSCALDEKALSVLKDASQAVLARIRIEGKEALLYDGVYDENLHQILFDIIARKKIIKSQDLRIVAYLGKRFKELMGKETGELSSRISKAEQSNTSILYGNAFFLKLYRRLEEGINPDLEIARFLTEKTTFSYMPAFAGAIEVKKDSQAFISLALLQAFVPNEGDAWTYTLDAVKRYYEEVLSKQSQLQISKEASCFSLEPQQISGELERCISQVYLEMVRLLGKRTAELHLALSSSQAADFSPEPFSKLYQRSVYQSMAGLTRRVLQLLAGKVKTLPEHLRKDAEDILGAQTRIMEYLQKILLKKFSAMKIRIHGDYHLGQVLFTGKDFTIIDFEGEPARPLSERRLKRSALRDVAGMMRSFHYAAYAGFFLPAATRAEDIPVLMPWADVWHCVVSNLFLRSYLDAATEAAFLPKAPEELKELLLAFILEKAIYELGYELNNRPDWIKIPIKGIQYILREHVE